MDVCYYRQDQIVFDTNRKGNADSASKKVTSLAAAANLVASYKLPETFVFCPQVTWLYSLNLCDHEVNAILNTPSLYFCKSILDRM